MHVERILERLGGVADAATLREVVSRRQLRCAVASGLILRDGRGRYSLPTTDTSLRAAHRLTAVVSHSSAATHWGWALKWQPRRPMVTVPRNRNVRAADRDIAEVFWADLRPHEVCDGHVRTQGADGDRLHASPCLR